MHRKRIQDWRALLGLFALVLQLFAGFAHHHEDGAGGVQHAYQASVAGHAGVLPLKSPSDHSSATEHDTQDGHDSRHDHDGDDEHACNICLALATLRTAQLPDPIAVLPPSTAGVSNAPVFASAATRHHGWRAHRARAPPCGLIA